MKRTYICLLYAIIIILTLSGCVPPEWVQYHPTAYPDTIWATADNRVVIEIEDFDGGYIRGYITTEDETKEVFFNLPKRPDICVKTKEQINTSDAECLECWEAQTPEKDKFIVNIVKTTCFNVGDVLTFYKVGENTNNDNHISRTDADKKAYDAMPQGYCYNWTPLFSRKETTNNGVCYVYYVSELSWRHLGDDQWTRDDIITYWIYIDAVNGEICDVIDTGYRKINITKEEALNKNNQKQSNNQGTVL